MSQLHIITTSIHINSGKTLLDEVIRGLPKDRSVHLYLDSRYSLESFEFSKNVNLSQWAPGFLTRYKVGRVLKKQVQPEDQILVLNNLPLPNEVSGQIFIFMQNRLIIDPDSPIGNQKKYKMKILLQRMWFDYYLKNTDRIIVQLQSMKRVLEKRFNNEVIVLPFAPMSNIEPTSERGIASKIDTYFYPANYLPHKNLDRLIEAWCMVNRENKSKKLILTVAKNELSSFTFQKVLNEKPNIEFHPHFTYSDVMKAYKKVDALIFPSLCESFGLPMIEAMQSHLPVLASNLDFVDDICNEAERFDPYDVDSIKKSVLMHKNKRELKLPNILNGVEFIQEISKIKPL